LQATGVRVDGIRNHFGGERPENLALLALQALARLLMGYSR